MSISSAIQSGAQATGQALASLGKTVSEHKKEVLLATGTVITAGILYAGYTYGEQAVEYLQETATSVYNSALETLGYVEIDERPDCSTGFSGKISDWWNSVDCKVAQDTIAAAGK